MRAASPPRQMERENEMIVISQPLFVLALPARRRKRIEDLRGAERGRTVFSKTKAKRDLLRPRTVCRNDEEAYPASSIPDLYTAIEFFYFIFYGRLDRYFPLLPFHEVRIEGRKWRNTQKVHR